MKKLYLVDVSAMFFRAYYAIRPLSSDKGVPTNAIYGYLSMTVKLLKEIQPDYLVYCFDRKEPSFRKDIDPRYKANRTEMPDDLKPQIPYIRELTDLLGIKALDKEGYEADDLIGSLAHYGRDQGLEVVIVSGDKDFGQLIKPYVTMYDTMKNKKYDVEGVLEKWGIHPDQFIDYLAITGDASDNIPGVKGIGPKGAQKLLSQYKNIEEIYENIDDIGPKGTHKKLVEAKDEAFLSKKLVTIVTDLDLVSQLDDLKMSAVKRDELQSLLNELSFQSFANKLLGEEDSSITGQFESRKQIGDLKSKKQAEEVPTDDSEIIEKLMSCEGALDKFVFEEEIWAWKTDRGIFLAQNDVVVELEDPAEMGAELAKINKSFRWKGYDLKSVWKELNLESGEAAFDSMLAAYILRAGPIENLDSIYSLYCGRQVPDLARSSQMYKIHLEVEEVLKKLMAEKKLDRVYNEIDLPILPILFKMERKGIALDTSVLKDISQRLEKEIKSVEKEVYSETGEEFNIGSPKQLGTVLFEKLKMPKGKKTKTGYSTSQDVLEKLAGEFPIVLKILKYRELSKLKSTYADALPELVNKKTGRIHTQFNQASTTTGRLSSVHPNLQNIPIRTEQGREIRKAFVASPGTQLVSVDYSQIELRILAHISEDPGLIKAFENDLDIHAATASEIFEVTPDKVSSEERRKAKAVNFGIAYGQGAYGLADALSIPRKEAKEIIERYFKRFSGVQNYMSDIVEKAKTNGYVETIFGRRRYLPELNSKSHQLRAFGERAAINAPIQGTASDLVKMAMLEVDQNIDSPIQLQVHDELILEVPDEKIEDTLPIVRERMEQCTSLKVPLKVNIATGTNWQDAHA